MNLSIAILLIVFAFSFLILLTKERRKGDFALIAVLINSGLSSWIAIQVLQGKPFEEKFYGGIVFGEIAIRADALSGWFILLMNFTMITGILYGRRYMKVYENRPAEISLHYISYVVNHFAMIGIFCIQNGLAFLCFWEAMTLSAFLMIIFERVYAVYIFLYWFCNQSRLCSLSYVATVCTSCRSITCIRHNVWRYYQTGHLRNFKNFIINKNELHGDGIYHPGNFNNLRSIWCDAGHHSA